MLDATKQQNQAFVRTLSPLTQEFIGDEDVTFFQGSFSIDVDSPEAFDYVINNLEGIKSKAEIVTGEEIKGGLVVHCKRRHESCAKDCKRKLGCKFVKL